MKKIGLAALTATYLVASFIVILYFVLYLYRLVGYKHDDISTAFNLLTTFVSFTIIQKWGYSLFRREIDTSSRLPINTKSLFISINTCILLSTLALYFFVLPNRSDANFYKGEQALMEGNFYSALDNFNLALFQNPENHKCHSALARVYEQLANNKKAIEHYQLSMTKQDKNYATYNDLARLYLSDKDTYMDTLRLLTLIINDIDSANNKSQDQDEIKAILYKNLSWTYLKLGIYDSSYDYAKKTVELMQTQPGAFTQYPAVYCLYALAHYHLNTAKNEAIEERCINNKADLKGTELELYVDLKLAQNKQISH